MRSFLPMAFGLLVFASVAWGQLEQDTGEETVIVPEYAGPDNFEAVDVANLSDMEDENITNAVSSSDAETEDLPEFDEDPGCSGECGPNDIQSGFDVATGSLGMNGHATPDVNQVPLQALPSGFDASSGVIGLGVKLADQRGEAGQLKPIDGGFNANTGELGLPTRRIECNDVPIKTMFTSFGSNYTVIWNVSPMTENVSCGETVTYATTADFQSVSNLQYIIAAWRAPMSIALYAPGTDFQHTIDTIRFLKNCTDPLISQFVTFHIYWPYQHSPLQIGEGIESLSQNIDCEVLPPWYEIDGEPYREQHNLVNPTNVGQNIAKLAAVTHYFMVTDYGMYPSENLASDFIRMITLNAQEELTTPNPKVFVVTEFVLTGRFATAPNKTRLRESHEKGLVKYTNGGYSCEGLDILPDPEWLMRPETKDLRVSAPLQRNGPLQFWNPVLIGTSKTPQFDHRVSLLGRRTRDWLLCAQDYEFLILNNAFGMRYENSIFQRPAVPSPINDQIAEEIRIMQNEILPEYQQVYGRDRGCVM